MLHEFRKHNKNRTLRLKIGSKNYFVKFCSDKNEYWNEIQGYNKIKDFYILPKRFYYVKFIIVYEYWGTVQNSSGLFCDIISNGKEEEVSAFMDNLTTTVLDIFCKTAKKVCSEFTVQKLYQDRCKEGQRLDSYYHKDFHFNIFDKTYISSNIEITINNKQISISFDNIVSDVKEFFFNNFETISVISQGDPTELNIGSPFTLFDYDTAGQNDVFGEFANFLWSIYFLSAYIVPLCNPLAYKGHENSLIINNKLDIKHCDSSNFFVSYLLVENRRLIIDMYIENVIVPFCIRNNITDIEKRIRPYLLLRIISVYNIFELDVKIIVFLILKLSQCIDANFSIQTFFNDEK